MEKIGLRGGVEMPLLGFGTFKIADHKLCRECVATAIEAGYRLIDTAQAYGNEEAVGAGIADALRRGVCRREDLFVTTKAWFKAYETDDCRAALGESLRKLGTGYVDLVLLHWPFGNVYSAWRVLEEAKASGKVRAIGVSNMDPDRFIDLCSFNSEAPAVNQVETHLYCQRRSEREWMAKYGIVCQAYAPLGQGRANEMFAEPAVAALAAKYGRTPAQILLRFLVQSGISAIPKSVHPERIRENAGIFGFSLEEREMDALRALDKAAPMIGTPADPVKVERAMTW